jgi:hypothetical protein
MKTTSNKNETKPAVIGCNDISEATATAQALGLTVKNNTWCYALYYLKDENGENIRNDRGEYIIISASLCIDNNNKWFLPRRWFKNGWIAEELPSYWSIDTYVHKPDGSCIRDYDPTIKRSDDGKRFVLNFDWVLPATADNLGRILSEVLRQFRAA